MNFERSEGSAAGPSRGRRVSMVASVFIELALQKRESAGAGAAYALKRQSVFCAEPGGHNRIRKGIADALLCGCIPVIFDYDRNASK